MLFGATRWASLHMHCCWVYLVFYSFPQRSFMPGHHSCLSHKVFPNLLLPFISSHINRKTQYENPVLEAKRKKQLEQQQQPPEGWHCQGAVVGVLTGSVPSLALAAPCQCVCPSCCGLNVQRQSTGVGKVVYALHVRCSQKKKTTPHNHFNIVAFTPVKREGFFCLCPLFVESF